MRLYPDPKGNLYPSVTSVLALTEPEEVQKRLQNWNRKQQASATDGEKTVGELARERGTHVHYMREQYILTGKADFISDEVSEYFEKIKPFLGNWDREAHVWCEKPTPSYSYPELVFFDQEMSAERGRLWSEEHGYAGCPDDVGMFRAKKDSPHVLTLCDVKTSNILYSNTNPGAKPNYVVYNRARKEGKESSSQRIIDRYYGYQKFWKTAIQLAAYSILVEERLGLLPEQWMVMVSPKHSGRFVNGTFRDDGQCFILTEPQMRNAKKEWLQRLEQFKAQYKDRQLAS